jgi:hypothetical protein
MPVLLVSTLIGAQDLRWDFKPTDARIELVMPDDAHVMVEAAAIRPAQMTRGSSGWNLTFEVPGETSERQLKGSPLFFILGPLNPNKPAHPFNLVKLDKKVGKRSWSMKVTDLDSYPFPGNEVIQLGRRPKPVQASDGTFTLSLAFVLPPGEYALFTDVEVWEFTIRAN